MLYGKLVELDLDGGAVPISGIRVRASLFLECTVEEMEAWEVREGGCDLGGGCCSLIGSYERGSFDFCNLGVSSDLRHNVS